MASEIKGTGIVASLAKLKNYFMGWHEQEYDNLHSYATNIATEQNTNKPATTQAIKDYVTNSMYDDTAIRNSITDINSKLGDTTQLPVQNNISQSIINLNNKVNGFKNANCTSNGFLSKEDYLKIQQATYYSGTTTYPSAASKEVLDGGYIVWRRYGRFASIRIRDFKYTNRNASKSYEISSHAGINEWTPLFTHYGGSTYDECKWIQISKYNDDGGWKITYKPKDSGTHIIHSTITFLCQELYPKC